MTSSSDSDDHKYDTVKLLENKKDLVKLSTVSKIKRKLTGFQKDKLEKDDKYLLKGIFVRKPKRFKEDGKRASIIEPKRTGLVFNPLAGLAGLAGLSSLKGPLPKLKPSLKCSQQTT
jgi:hypothetical protein